MLNLLEVMTNRKKNQNKLQDKILEVLNSITNNSEINKAEVSDLIKELQNDNSQFFFDSDRALCEGSNDEENEKIDLPIHESKLKSFIDNRKEAIWSIDTDYKLIIFNDFFKEQFLTAYKIKLEKGVNVLELLNPELVDLWKEKLDIALSGENVVFEFSEKLGEKVIFCQVSLYPIFSEGKISAVSAFGIDITKRKEEERALKESEEKYKEITESTIDIIFLVDIKGKILFINKSMKNVLGYKVEEVINKSFRKFVPSKEVPNCLTELVKVFRKEEVKNFITQIYHKKGHLVDVEINGKLIKYEGEYAGQGTIKDISEKFLIDKVIKESEENYRGIFNSVTDAICIQDKNGVIIDVNAGAEKMYGYKRENLIGKTHESITSPNNNGHDKIRKATVAAYNGQEQKLEFLGLRKNGEVFPNYVSLFQGQYFGKKVVIGIAQDISERKINENIIEKSEVKYRSIFDNDKMIMLLLDPQSKKIVDANSGAEKFYGWTRDELKKMKITHIEKLTPHQVKERIKMVTNSKSNYFEFEHTKKDNSVCDVSVIKGDININDKKLFYILVTDITEQKRAREEICKSEKKYLEDIKASEIKFKNLIQFAPEPFFQGNKEGDFIECNEAATLLTGYSRKELLEMNMQSLFSKKMLDREPVQYNLLNEGETIQSERKLVTKDGKIKLVEMNSKRMEDGTFLSFIRDITERKKSEKALLESEERYRKIVLNLRQAYFETDNTGLITHCTPELSIISEYSENELIGKTSFSLVEKKDRARVIAEYKKCLSEKKSYLASEFKVTIKSGNSFWVEQLTNFQYNEKGKLLKASNIVKDISERKKSEEALKTSENLFRNLSKSTATAIVVYQNEKFVFVNEAAEKLTGYSKEELLGMNFWEVVHPEFRELVHNRGLARQRGEKVTNRYHLKLMKKDGTEAWIDFTGEQINWAGKDAAIGSAFCITELKMAEEKLKQSEERYKLITKLTSDYLFTVSIDENGKSTTTWIAGSFEEITGYTFKEYEEKGGWVATIHPDDLEKDKAAFEKLKKNEKVIIEIRTIHKSGKIVWVESFGSPVWGKKKNRLVGINGAVRDITMEKLASIAMRENEEKYKLISSLTSDYLFESKYNEQNVLEVIWVAGSFEKMTGYSLEEYKAVGGWQARLHKDDVKIDNKAVKKLHQNKKAFLEVRTYHKNGDIIWVRNSCSPIWDPVQKEIIGITGAVTNITEEKHQQLIRQIQYNIANAIVNVKSTNKLFSIVRTELLQLIDASNFYVAFYDEDKDLLTTVVDYNKDKIISWRAEKSMTGIVIEEDKKIFIHKNEILALAKSKKIKLSGEIPEVWLGVPLHITGKVFGAIVIQSYDDPDAYDKSSIELMEVIASQLSLFIERDKAEKDALRLSHAIVQSPVSVVITNVDGDIEYVNPMFEKVTGYAFEEVFGKNPRFLNSGQHSQGFYKDLWGTILSGKDWHGEFHNKKKNGELYWENAIISPIENEKEEITHFVAIKEDITEKKKMLGEIIISKEQAVASEKIKTEFLAQISHEIRSPLNVIMSFIELIKGELEGNLTPDMEDSFQSIDSASSRIIRTIDLILNMTDLQLGSYIISLVEVDVVSMLKRIKSEYLKSAHNKGLELRLELEFNRKKITSDEYALIQILSNLVDNAIKYTDTGYISIIAKKDAKNGLIIKVTDTGIGMKKEFLPMIFSSFTQEEQGYSRTFDGNGLGMALVKNYCEVISADISVQSAKGKGTTFSLLIPNLKK